MATASLTQHNWTRTGGMGGATAATAQPGSGKLAFGGLLFFIALVYTNPSNLFPAIGDYGYAKMAAGLALAALGGSWLLADRRLTWGGAVGVCMGLFFLLVALSGLWSLWPSLTAATFSDGIKYLAILYLVANVVDTRARAIVLLHALALASLAPAIGTISSWSRGEYLVEGDRAGWIGIFGNPNDLAYYLVIGGAMTLAARESSSSRIVRGLYLGVLAVLATALFLTQSRGGLVAAGTVLALWAVRSMRANKLAALGILVVVLGAMHFAPENTWKRASTTLAYQQDASAQGRIDAWRTGMRILEDRPLTGVGAGAFMLAWPEYAPGDAGPPRTAHNTFVQLVSETGLPSLLLFMGAIALALWQCEKTARARPDLELPARATMVGLVGFLVSSFTGGLAYSWPLYLLLGLGAAIPRIDLGGTLFRAAPGRSDPGRTDLGGTAPAGPTLKPLLGLSPATRPTQPQMENN